MAAVHLAGKTKRNNSSSDSDDEFLPSQKRSRQTTQHRRRNDAVITQGRPFVDRPWTWSLSELLDTAPPMSWRALYEHEHVAVAAPSFDVPPTATVEAAATQVARAMVFHLVDHYHVDNPDLSVHGLDPDAFHVLALTNVDEDMTAARLLVATRALRLFQWCMSVWREVGHASQTIVLTLRQPGRDAPLLVLPLRARPEHVVGRGIVALVDTNVVPLADAYFARLEEPILQPRFCASESLATLYSNLFGPDATDRDLARFLFGLCTGLPLETEMTLAVSEFAFLRLDTRFLSSLVVGGDQDIIRHRIIAPYIASSSSSRDALIEAEVNLNRELRALLRPMSIVWTAGTTTMTLADTALVNIAQTPDNGLVKRFLRALIDGTIELKPPPELN